MNIVPGESKLVRIPLTILFCIIGITPLAPILLWLGYRRLKHMPEDDPNYKPLKYILLFEVILLVVLGSYLIYMFTHTTSGENEATVRWLPQFCTNVSYHRDLQHDCYEYDIAEKDFLAFLNTKLEKKPISAESPVEITRYAKFMDGKSESEHKTVVTDGYVTHFEKDNRSFLIVFDRKKSRVYFLSEMKVAQ